MQPEDEDRCISGHFLSADGWIQLPSYFQLRLDLKGCLYLTCVSSWVTSLLSDSVFPSLILTTSLQLSPPSYLTFQKWCLAISIIRRGKWGAISSLVRVMAVMSIRQMAGVYFKIIYREGGGKRWKGTSRNPCNKRISGWIYLSTCGIWNAFLPASCSTSYWQRYFLI